VHNASLSEALGTDRHTLTLPFLCQALEWSAGAAQPLFSLPIGAAADNALQQRHAAGLRPPLPSPAGSVRSDLVLSPSPAASVHARRDVYFKSYASRLPSTRDVISLDVSEDVDAARVLPLDRSSSASAPLRFGCVVAEAEVFDRGAFKMGETETRMTDPQQRLLLEHAASALAACAGAVGISHLNSLLKAHADG
jgi:hypothetical protein